jgi:hypothetical protein
MKSSSEAPISTEKLALLTREISVVPAKTASIPTNGGRNQQGQGFPQNAQGENVNPGEYRQAVGECGKKRAKALAAQNWQNFEELEV